MIIVNVLLQLIFYEKLRLHLTHCFSFSIQQPMMPKGKSSTATAIAARRVNIFKFVIQKKMHKSVCDLATYYG